MGRAGERRAAAFLKDKGYKILERNFSCGFGEIDIIAKKGGLIVFLEVKTRTASDYGRGAESVNKEKINKIRRAAAYYLNKIKEPEACCRFDVIEINEGKMEHIEDAF